MLRVTLALFVTYLIVDPSMTAFVKLTNAICQSKNISWVTIDYCRLRAISRNRGDLTVEVTVLHPAKDIHLGLKVEKKANGYLPFLIDLKVDACAFIRKANNPVVKMFYGIIKSYTTLNHTCPYMGKQVIKDFHYEPTNLTLPVPTGDYRLLLSWFFDGRIQFTSDVYFHFQQDIWKD